MKINNFENFISNYILDRGYEYYLDGLVIELKEVDFLTFIAIVKGNDEYELVVELDNDWNIIGTECDCPHHVPLCKHLVAVFYSLKDILSHKKDNVSLSKGELLKQLLMKQDKEKLIDTFLKLTSEHHDLQESLFLRFNESNNFDTFKELLENIVIIIENDYEPEQKHLDRFDNIIIDIYQNLNQLLDKKEFIAAMDLCFLILNSLVRSEVLNDLDDYYNEYYEALETIKKIAEQTLKLKKEDISYKYLMNKLYITEDKDLRDNIIEILLIFTKYEKYRFKIEELIKTENEDFFEHWLQLQMRIHEINDEPEKIKQLVSNNINYSSMKEYAINQ